jgi:hypothetical protein
MGCIGSKTNLKIAASCQCTVIVLKLSYFGLFLYHSFHLLRLSGVCCHVGLLQCIIFAKSLPFAKDINILPSSTSSFVGFLLDEKLYWKSHVEAKCQAAQRQIHTLWRCLGRTWGLDTNKLVTLYKTIIIPKLLYGCSIWCCVILIKTYKSKIQAVQRTMLKCITRSSNNVSLNALIIISNLLPIDLKKIFAYFTLLLN